MDVTEICPLTYDAVATLLANRQAQAHTRSGTSRRRAVRWEFPGTVELWLPHEDGGDRYILATSINLSADGIGIQSDEELAPGLNVGIAVHEPEVSFHGRAVVRHCTHAVGETHIVGLQFLFDDA